MDPRYRNFALGALGAAIVLALAGNAFTRWLSSPKGVTTTEQSAGADSSAPADNAASIGGIAPRDYDAANARSEWSDDSIATDRWRGLANNPREAGRLHLEGGFPWIPTGLALNDMHNYDIYERCRDFADLAEDDSCIFDLDLVIDARQQQIAYTRFRSRDATELSEKCVAFASCAAQARIGQRVPLPRDTEDTAVTQQIRARPIPKSWKDPAHLDELIATLELDLKAAREQLAADQTDDPDLAYQYRSQEQLAAYLRERSSSLAGSK